MKKQSLLSAAFMAAVFVLPSETVLAQVEVVESSNRLITHDVRQPATPAEPVGGVSGAAEAFYQLQLLQQEVAQLRGLVEEQSFEIKRLKQQRLDDYLNLDKRLSAISSGALPSSESVTPISAGQASQAAGDMPNSVAATNGDESAQYRAAIDLILKKKDYIQAEKSLNKHLEDFPKGRYAANSQYWLGELALLNGDLEKSRQWFARMVTEWPEHPKVNDANYKLGTVYHKLGDATKAKAILDKVASGSSNASRLAAGYLKTNFK